ncbi:hypothetical protein L0128_05215 [candidate division KSB1 bacterium]|nr:hypothetical protein [candidate division KSB1 bacterium]
MPYPVFDRQRLQLRPLAARVHDMNLKNLLAADAPAPPLAENRRASIRHLAERIKHARQNNKAVILSYGAHLIKNGLGPVLNRLIEQNWVTLLCTNGAGAIHDWELAFLGASTESVRRYVGEGQFGMWDETGRYMNLALMLGAAAGQGYGEALGAMIEQERLEVPNAAELRAKLQTTLNQPEIPATDFGAQAELLAYLNQFQMPAGPLSIPHPHKDVSVLRTAYHHHVPLCVMPGIGYDIIYTHYLNNGAAIGKTALRDFLTFTDAQLQLDGGVFIAVGSAIMAPMTFEKGRAMARNIARQEGRSLDDTLIVVNDIQPAGDDWNLEPTKASPAYYLRFLKTYRRMHGEFEYIELDNREFLLNLLHLLA